MKIVLGFVLFIILIIGNSSECFSQEFGWKRLTEEDIWIVDYIDTLNIDTVGNLIYFYIKEKYPDEEYHKRNLHHPDSVYKFFSANTEIPELNMLMSIDFHRKRNVRIHTNIITLGCDLLNFGIGNLVYVNYYYLITGKMLFHCP